MTRQMQTHEWAVLRPNRLPGVDHLSARYVKHSFPRHSHDDGYVLAVIEDGLQTSDFGAGRKAAPAGALVLINPGELHDGQPGTDLGYTYHSFHVAMGVLTDIVEEARADGEILSNAPVDGLPYFGAHIVENASVSAAFARTCRSMVQGWTTPIEDEGAILQALRHIAGLCVGFRSHEGIQAQRGDPSIRRAREILHDSIADTGMTVARLAGLCGRTRAHMTREFRRAYGLPPHAYLVNLRLADARRRLRGGEAPALVAAAVGFADQSHLTRRFKRAFGVTPGKYAGARPA